MVGATIMRNLHGWIAMELNELETFLAVSRHKSFTSAAWELRLTQPGVSRQIQKIERELEVILVERRRGNIRLTSAGERFKNYAEDALERHRQFLSSLVVGGGVLTGDLSIIASTTTGAFIVPDLVARFTALHPDVVPEVFVTDTAQVVEEMADTRWDIGFVGARLPGRGLRYEVIGTDEILLAVSSSHPFAKRNEVDLSELEGQPFLEREGGSGTLRSVHAALAKYGSVLPPHPVAMGVSSPQAILAGVERGYGMGWVSALAFGSGRNGRVVPVRVKGLPLRRYLYLVQNRQRALPAVATTFVDWVRNENSAKPSLALPKNRSANKAVVVSK